jgi:hypothetical protein
MNEVTIGAAISTIMNSMASLRHVYDSHESQVEGYPAATIEVAEREAEFADTMRNQNTYTYTVRIVQERQTVGTTKAERIVREIADEAIALFDANYKLNNTCNFVMPITTRPFYAQSPTVDTRGVELTIKAIVVQ